MHAGLFSGHGGKRNKNIFHVQKSVYTNIGFPDILQQLACLRLESSDLNQLSFSGSNGRLNAFISSITAVSQLILVYNVFCK